MKTEQDATVDAAVDAAVEVNNEWGADTAAADWGAAPTTEVAAENTSPPADDKAEGGRPRREREPEEEDNTLTLDQYLAQQKEKESVIPKLESTRQANEGSDATIWKDVVPLSKEGEDAYFVGKVECPSQSFVRHRLILLLDQVRPQGPRQERRKGLPRDRSTF